ncbi:MAG: DNA alkylation repair protein [Anaerolineae bacterium]|nr:DNA alkylation repair protein [Anaerolineae bacterium]
MGPPRGENGRHDQPQDARALAAQFDAEIRALPVQNTASTRALRRRYSRALVDADATYVHALVAALVHGYGYRGTAYELIRYHKAAFARTGVAELERLGRGIDSWWAVDGFARTLAGPAWLRGQIDDSAIHRWAHSPDRWWRRAALVSTVALNMRSTGGYGDVARTLTVCRLLVGDRDDMVVKAMSWALRALAPHDPGAVRAFLAAHQDVLAARVLREVRHKLDTGLKNPRRRG